MLARLLCLTLLLLTGFAHAQGVQALKDYFQSVQSLSGEFEQTTRSDTGELLETASGAMYLQRPDRFRWNYREPFEQEIVADGRKLWVYDRELAQVTVRPLSDVLGLGPALLLSGDYRSIEQSFVIQDEGDGWVRLTPKQDDWDFQAVRLRMVDGVPAVVEVDSGLGQVTRLELRRLQRNVRIEPSRFEFTPPAGVDVIAPGG